MNLFKRGLNNVAGVSMAAGFMLQAPGAAADVPVADSRLLAVSV